MPCDCSWCNPARSRAIHLKQRDKKDLTEATKKIICEFTKYSDTWNPEDGDKNYKSYGTLLKKCQCADCLKEKVYMEGLK